MKNYKFPPVNLLRSSFDGPAPFTPGLLKSRVPLERPTGSDDTELSPITYEAYTAALKRFVIRQQDYLSQIVAANACNEKVEKIDLIVEKHGPDYHPAHIVINKDVHLVLNVAFTERSQTLLKNEFDHFRYIRRKISTDSIPEMYLLDSETLEKPNGNTSRMLIMMGDWLEGFHEFHLSNEAKGRSLRLLLWDMDHGYTFLSESQSEVIWRKAAYILTNFYDAKTFEEIFPWHHASGDFVASPVNEELDLKLITIRQYGPRLEFHEHSPENQVTAMALFLVNLSIQMRLDRLDGVGEIVWAPDCSVEPTLKGFIDALRRKVEDGKCDERLMNGFSKNLKQLCPSELTKIFQAVVESYDSEAPDIPIINSNLAHHIFSVYKAIQRVL
jgi:hypothetical protein